MRSGHRERAPVRALFESRLAVTYIQEVECFCTHRDNATMEARSGPPAISHQQDRALAESCGSSRKRDRRRLGNAKTRSRESR